MRLPPTTLGAPSPAKVRRLNRWRAKNGHAKRVVVLGGKAMEVDKADALRAFS